MFRMFKAETLIKEIEQRPHIWDKTDVDYHNHVRKDAAWKDVCQKLYKNWDSSNATTRQEMCNEVKKKWANIRDNYRKYLVKKLTTEQAGSETVTKRYVYSKLLKFLNPIFKSDKKRSEFETVSFDSNMEEDNEDEEQNAEYLEPDEQEALDVLDIKYDPEEGNGRKRQRRSSFQPTSIVHQNVQKSIEIDTDDDDTLFLLSFRSDMKEMDNDQKVEFKIGMLKLLQQIR